MEATQFDPDVAIFRDPESPAAGELLLRLIHSANEPQTRWNKSLAVPLFAAIATDTGWFRYGGRNSETYREAAQLIDYGAEPLAIYHAIYEQESLAKRRLLASFTDHMELHCDGRLATSYLLQNDFAKHGAIRSDSDDMVNELLRVRGVEVAILLTEQVPTKPGAAPEVRMNFRSRNGFNCESFARTLFGGGGHVAAAGGSSWESIDETLRKILTAIEPLLNEMPRNPTVVSG